MVLCDCYIYFTDEKAEAQRGPHVEAGGIKNQVSEIALEIALNLSHGGRSPVMISNLRHRGVFLEIGVVPSTVPAM